jgi:hypothetical protein
MVAPSTR